MTGGERRSAAADDASTPTDPGGTAEVGYAEAVAELDAILRELDGTDVDVDRLADRVQRAAVLIAACRDRISGARLRIDAVIADLDDTAGLSAAHDPDDPTEHGTAGDETTA